MTANDRIIPQEHRHVVAVVVGGDPFEALGGTIPLPQGGVRQIEQVERLGELLQPPMRLVVQHEPFQLVFKIPFAEGTVFASHKQQLLPGWVYI